MCRFKDNPNNNSATNVILAGFAIPSLNLDLTIAGLPGFLTPYTKGPLGMVVGLIGLAVLLMFFVLIYVRIFGSGKARKLRKQAIEIEDFVESYKDRLSKIEPHAIDYFNSLSGEGKQAFSLAKKIIQAMDRRLEEISEILQKGNSRSIARGLRITEASLSLTVSSVHSVTMSQEPIPDIAAADVEAKLQEVFAIIGKELAKASAKDKVLRERSKTPKRQRRKTIYNLRDAGFIDHSEDDEEEEDEEKESSESEDREP